MRIPAATATFKLFCLTWHINMYKLIRRLSHILTNSLAPSFPITGAKIAICLNCSIVNGNRWKCRCQDGETLFLASLNHLKNWSAIDWWGENDFPCIERRSLLIINISRFVRQKLRHNPLHPLYRNHCSNISRDPAHPPREKILTWKRPGRLWDSLATSATIPWGVWVSTELLEHLGGWLTWP